MTLRPTATLSGILLSLFIGGLPAAVPASAQMAETIDVALVNLEIWVEDRNGHPVLDLEREDFLIRAGGRPVQVTHFASIDRRRTRPLASELLGAALDQPQRLTLYIEMAFLRPGELSAVVPTLGRFLRQDLSKSVPVMLAVADPDFRIVEGFTTDRETVVSRLEELADSGFVGRIDKEYSQIQRQFEQALDRASSGAMPFVPGSQAESVLTQIGGFAAIVQQEMVRAATRLDNLVRTLRGLPGPREVLFLTGRPPVHAGQALFAAWQVELGDSRVFSQSSPGPGGGFPTEDSAGTGVSDTSVFGSRSTAVTDLNAAGVLRRKAIESAAAGVVLNAVDLSSPQQGGSLISSATAGQGVVGSTGGGFARRASIHQGVKDLRVLRELAELTGGRLLMSSTLAEQLSALAAERARFYSLAFTPAATLEERTHELEVRLNRDHADLVLTYRRFVRPRSADERSAEAVVSSMLSGEVQNPLAATFEVKAQQESERSTVTAHLQLLLPFSRIALRPEGSDHIGQLSVFYFAGERLRSATAVRKDVLPVRIANEEMLTALGRSIEYSWQMELPGETSHVAIGIRDDQGGLWSSLVTEIESDS